MSRRAQILFVLLACLIVSSVWGASPPTSYWQLVFQYDGPVLQLLTADRIPPISKSVRTPGLASAPVRLTYECQWLDGGGQLIHSGSTQLPLGLRSALGEGEPCRVIMPDEGVIVVRLAGPDQSVTPSSIRLTDSPSVDKSALALPLPAAFEHHSWTFPLPAPSLSAAPMDGPLAVI